MTSRAGWALTVAVGAAAAAATWAYSERARLFAPSPSVARVKRADDARVGGRAVHAGDKLGAGDRVEAASGALDLELPAGEQLALRAPGSLEPMKLGSDGSELWLHRGALLVDAPRRKRATPLVYTREATCASVGARFLLDAGDGKTVLRVARGAVHVEGLHRTAVDVHAGQRLELTTSDLAHPPPPAQPEADPTPL